MTHSTLHCLLSTYQPLLLRHAKPTPLKRQISPLSTILPFKSPQILNPLASSYFSPLQNSLLHHFSAKSVQKKPIKVVVTLLKLIRKNDYGNHLYLALILQPCLKRSLSLSLSLSLSHSLYLSLYLSLRLLEIKIKK